MTYRETGRMSRRENITWSCFVAFCLISSQHGCTAATDEDQNTNQSGTQAKDIIFFVLSQSNEYHQRQAADFKAHFEEQLSQLDKNHWPQLLFTHTSFEHVNGAWTIFPLIEQIIIRIGDKTRSWIVFCEEDTRIKVEALVMKLRQFKATEHVFLGRELRDREPTIIHHFAFADDDASQFAYPDFRAGFVMSISLVKHLHIQLQTQRQKTDFSIDPKHELALFVWNKGSGTKLTHVREFCSVDSSSDYNCITYQPSRFPECGGPIEKSDLFVAVKTCKQFHETRVPIVKATWGKEAGLIEYFSEVADKSIPTLDLGVPNTERGHCAKTMAIIQRVINTPALSGIHWLLIADDDTIINLDRLRALLACYDPAQPVALGERYGYGVANGGGYDYITGGGGMVFSRPVVAMLSRKCRCHSDNAPDDMILGMCLQSLGVPVTHSRYFHQARPEDYSQEFLANQLPISFHKHWNTDPYKVYAELTSSSLSSAADDDVQERCGAERQKSSIHPAKKEEL